MLLHLVSPLTHPVPTAYTVPLLAAYIGEPNDTAMSIAAWNSPQRYWYPVVIVYGFLVGHAQYDKSATLGTYLSPLTITLLTDGFTSVLPTRATSAI